MKLILAEKPSVAKTIASFLGAKTRCDGYFEGNGYIVTYAVGHLVGLYDMKDYDAYMKGMEKSKANSDAFWAPDWWFRRESMISKIKCYIGKRFSKQIEVF